MEGIFPAQFDSDLSDVWPSCFPVLTTDEHSAIVTGERNYDKNPNVLWV